MNSTSLKINNLSFSYDKKGPPIFRNINLDFYEGELIGLYGENGSGKTTLLNCLAGYYIPSEGEILFNDFGLEKDRKNISIISAKMDLFEYLTLGDNISFFLEFYKKPFNTDELKLLLEKYDIQQYKDNYVYEASKGMLKKTQIVIALLLKPKLLIGDEPTDGLDEKSQEQFFMDIKELSQNYNTISLFSLHNERVLQKHCDKIIYLFKDNSSKDYTSIATLVPSLKRKV